MIVMFTGSTAPSGWAICNGSNGTPDLRDRFIVGQGSSYSINNTGGSKNAIVVSHSHSVSDPGHNHSVSDPGHSHVVPLSNDGGSNCAMEQGDNRNERSQNTNSANTGISISSANTGLSISSQGSSGTNANLPPYYALAFIMKT